MSLDASLSLYAGDFRHARRPCDELITFDQRDYASATTDAFLYRGNSTGRRFCASRSRACAIGTRLSADLKRKRSPQRRRRRHYGDDDMHADNHEVCVQQRTCVWRALVRMCDGASAMKALSSNTKKKTHTQRDNGLHMHSASLSDAT